MVRKLTSTRSRNPILKHHSVHSVALVAMPDPTYGERACAFVVLKPGAALTFAQLTEFLLGQNVAKFKLPERLELLPEFPCWAPARSCAARFGR